MNQQTNMGGGDHYSNGRSEDPLPLHLCFFLLVLFTFVGLTWYVNYESMVESVLDQVKLVLLVGPLVLLLALHLLSALDDGRSVSPYFPLPERDSLHRAGGTPWGLGFLLVFLFFMVSYQSYFRESWFPLLG